jgi:hypothetical protein
MGDMGDFYRERRDEQRQHRLRHGVSCPRCQQLQPRRDPTILLPGQRCRVDGYVDPRADGGSPPPEAAPEPETRPTARYFCGVGFHLNGRTSPKRDTRITMAVDADSERAACDFMRQLARDRGADAVNYAWALPMEGGQLSLPVPPPAEGS